MVNEKNNFLPKLGRRERRKLKKYTGVMVRGIQDSKEATLQVYYVPMKRKSRAGVEYIYYKKVVDKVGLKKNKNENSKNVEHNA